MTITLTLLLASGESCQDIPVQLLSNGIPIARTTVLADGRAVFDAPPTPGPFAVRVDRSSLSAS
ncbi:hypothetical protein [Azospirillum doebereinerae]